VLQVHVVLLPSSLISSYNSTVISYLPTGSHSLWALSTFIVEDTQFPEFSAVVMLDDVQIMYYNSNDNSISYRASASELSESEQNDANIVFRHKHKSMKYRALESKTHHNLTRGINVQQRIAGCELMDSSSSSPVLSWDAFNGEPVEELIFNKYLNTMESHGLWPATWNQIKQKTVQILYANLYHPLCIKTLKHYLSKEKNRVIRKVKPRVRLVSKDGGTRVSCLATGFYPRHINLTLSRDGQPVDEEQTTGGELLPNADGTYQMRKTLDVTPEDLKESHKFTCTATHLSLDNKLDVSLGNSCNITSNNVYFICTLLLDVMLCFSKNR
uniref:Ig-like domain-containing protein n=1 Tax=Denticeps clupeoides TaxID=299321 RepID=A0AAY4DAR1_9TELE